MSNSETLIDKLLKERGLINEFMYKKLKTSYYKWQQIKDRPESATLENLLQVADLFQIDRSEFILNIIKGYKKPSRINKKS